MNSDKCSRKVINAVTAGFKLYLSEILINCAAFY